MTNEKTKSSAYNFINNVLNGTAIAIVVALIPNAVLKAALTALQSNYPAIKPYLVDYLNIITIFQFFIPVMAGFLIAHQFNMKPMQMIAVGGATFIGSGAWKVVEATIGDKTGQIFQLAGTGDLINAMVTAALAVAVIQLVGHHFGALEIILLPIVVGSGVGLLGYKLLPYVKQVTDTIGHVIETFVQYQPFVMSILICMSFAILILTPISTVAIGLAISLSGLSAGAASMGVGTTALYLVWATHKKNKPGVPTAIALGAMKMMMPNYLTHPIMSAGLLLSSAITAVLVPVFNLTGTPQTSGFGLVGLVGPIASLPSLGNNFLLMLLIWVAVPAVVTFLVHFLFTKVLKLYDEEIFVFKGSN